MTSNKCNQCNAAIINPICDNCRTKKLEFLLANSMSRPLLIRMIADVKKIFLYNPKSGVLCSQCNMNLVAACNGCYLLAISRILAIHLPKDFAARLVYADKIPVTTLGKEEDER